MTKKDFELIAAAIKRAREPHALKHLETVETVLDGLARDLAGELRQTNPKFDAVRFLRACGVDA